MILIILLNYFFDLMHPLNDSIFLWMSSASLTKLFFFLKGLMETKNVWFQFCPFSFTFFLSLCVMSLLKCHCETRKIFKIKIKKGSFIHSKVLTWSFFSFLSFILYFMIFFNLFFMSNLIKSSSNNDVR